MRTIKYYLVFHITDDREVSIALFNGAKEIKHKTIRPPETVSETLWKVIPQWLSSKEKKDAVEAIGFLQDKDKGTHSTVRTILSIINLLGIVENISTVRLSKGEGIIDLLENSKKHNSRGIEVRY